MSVLPFRWPFVAVLLATLLVPLVGGCSKYDSYERNMERNMRYVSSEVLVSESVVSFERLKTAHDAWVASSRPEALDTFRDLYGQYEVIYNELMDRAGGRPINHLAKFAGALPPPPPGVPIEGLPTTPLPTPVTADGGSAPTGPRFRPTKPDKTVKPEPASPPDTGVSKTRSSKPALSDKPAQAVPARGNVPENDPGQPEGALPAKGLTVATAETYSLRPGDTPALVAKRFKISQARLVEVNALTDPQKLTVGQTLVIPKD
jgi:LysM repeat protein